MIVGGTIRISREEARFTSQLNIFPEGQMCVEFDGRIVASASHNAQLAIFAPSDIPFAHDAIQSEATPNIQTMSLMMSISNRSSNTGKQGPY